MYQITIISQPSSALDENILQVCYELAHVLLEGRSRM